MQKSPGVFLSTLMSMIKEKLYNTIQADLMVVHTLQEGRFGSPSIRQGTMTNQGFLPE